MPGYILSHLIQIVTTPGTEDIGSWANPSEELGKDGGKEGGLVHLILSNGGQLSAEVAELRMNDGANEVAELISDLALVDADSADFDDLHFVPMLAIVPASGFEVADDEVGVDGLILHRIFLSLMAA